MYLLVYLKHGLHQDAIIFCPWIQRLQAVYLVHALKLIFPIFILFYQVGIIGRTGAGKSSILNALFRLTPICKGCILVDGLDIADVPVRDLRSHFAVVPQSPFLFEGSLRYSAKIFMFLHCNSFDYLFIQLKLLGFSFFVDPN